MRRLILKLSLFLAPVAGVLVLELAVWPADLFTFRIQEALQVRHLGALLPGPFYPNQHLEKIESGDLGHGTPHAQPRHSVWRTDRHGYRNTPEACAEYPVVLVGDSNVYGGALTQDATLAEVFRQQFDTCAYAFAPAKVDEFLQAYPTVNALPRTVVFFQMERGLTFLPEEELGRPPLTEASRFWRRVRESSALQPIATLLDRLTDPLVYRFLQVHGFPATVQRVLSGRVADAEGAENKMLFFSGDPNETATPLSLVPQLVAVAQQERDRVRALGMRFLFVPVPDKETIYREALGTSREARFLPALLTALREHGVETVDLATPFRQAVRDEHRTLHFRDDTHWNAEGVQLAASLVNRAIREGGPQRELSAVRPR